MSSMDQKVAVVTGAMRGVGFAIAEAFIENGADVVLTDVDQQGLDDAVAQLGAKSSGVLADVTDSKQMDAMFQTVVEKHGQLDAVVANAGVGDSAPLGSITGAQFDKIYNINVKGVLFTFQGALPHLHPGATMLAIGSTGSIQAQYGMSLYCGSKAALRGALRAWIIELKGSGIRVNLLSPGAVDTPSLRLAFAGASGPDEVDAKVAAMGEQNPLGRLVSTNDVAKAAVFLSTDASGGSTGIELFVDGGVAQTG
jgi:NAD(P)-dependent dehydrogenase (short-subunit alcohol dehydrogenase family)